ncbi:MAG: hypothetical protein K1000chlam3_00371 [Chlamydiae bacterium]|nr:hypothetical protein [Chlamydiota bacterium]
MTSAVTAGATKLYEVEFKIGESGVKDHSSIIAALFEKHVDRNPTPIGMALNIIFFENGVQKNLSYPLSPMDAAQYLQKINQHQGQFRIEGKDVYII